MSPLKDLILSAGVEETVQNTLLYLCFATQSAAFVVILTGMPANARPLEHTIALSTTLTSLSAIVLLAETALYLSRIDTLISVFFFLLATLVSVNFILRGVFGEGGEDTTASVAWDEEEATCSEVGRVRLV